MSETNTLAVRRIDFKGANLLAMQNSSGEIFVDVRSICLGIGLSTVQATRQITKIRKSCVLLKSVADLQTRTEDGMQRFVCIQLDYVPLWLAKITITSKMRQEDPEIAERLLQFQLKAKDVLAAAFLPQYAATGTSVRMTDFEVASLLAEAPKDNLIAVAAYLQHNNYNVPDLAASANTLVLLAAQDTVKQFALEILPQCSWRLLPFKFLHDLYKAWLRENHRGKKPLGRNVFNQALRQTVESESSLKDWALSPSPIHPGSKMNAPEPLAEKYKLTGWIQPSLRTSYKGFVRV